MEKGGHLKIKIHYVYRVVSYSITSVGYEVDPGFLAVSPQLTLVINPVVGCRYFPLGPRLYTFPANSVHTADTDKTRQFCLVRVDGLNCELGIYADLTHAGDGEYCLIYIAVRP